MSLGRCSGTLLTLVNACCYYGVLLQWVELHVKFAISDIQRQQAATACALGAQRIQGRGDWPSGYYPLDCYHLPQSQVARITGVHAAQSPTHKAHQSRCELPVTAETPALKCNPGGQHTRHETNQAFAATPASCFRAAVRSAKCCSAKQRYASAYFQHCHIVKEVTAVLLYCRNTSTISLSTDCAACGRKAMRHAWSWCTRVAIRACVADRLTYN